MYKLYLDIILSALNLEWLNFSMRMGKNISKSRYTYLQQKYRYLDIFRHCENLKKYVFNVFFCKLFMNDKKALQFMQFYAVYGAITVFW